MTKLKLGPIAQEKPVRLTIDLPATLHRDLAMYSAVLAQENGQPVPDPKLLIVPMLERFMATDRAFAKARRKSEGRDLPSRPTAPMQDSSASTST